VTPLKAQYVSDFRRSLADNYKAARRGQPVAVTQKHDNGAAILLADELVVRLLDDVRFSPQVYTEGEQVGVWLPELDLYALGADLAEAEEDLLEEVREYYTDFWQDYTSYSKAPNRTGHVLHALRAYVADIQGGLASVIFSREPADA